MSNIDKYNNINSPLELLEFMSNIKYDNFDRENLISNYHLKSIDELLDTMSGNCFDQVELERDWFNKHNYKFKTYFQIIELDYDNSYPMHSFLVYEEDNKYYWFENAWEEEKGIHKYDDLKSLLKDVYNKSLLLFKSFNISDEELNNYSLYEYSKPNSNINIFEYIEFVSKGNKINDNLLKK